jgi:hypothetical protein
MKSQKAREYFISIQINEDCDIVLSERLATLTLYTNNILNLKNFNDELSKIIDWNKVNNIKYMIENNKIPENIDFILNIHAWSRRNFIKSLGTGNIEKLIISFLIGYYLFLEPYNDFQWNRKTTETQKNLEKLMPRLKVEIKILNSDSYSDKKYYNDYVQSLKNNSYKEIFDFLASTDRGNNYDHYFTDFIYSIVVICMKINISLISDNIKAYDPTLIKLIFNCMEPHQVIKLLDEYNDTHPLTLLIGLIHIINPTWNNIYNASLNDDYEYIELSAKIIKKISKLIVTSDLYKFISECSNISGNKLWHSIFIAFAVQNQEYLNSYINNIDFSYESGAENVFDIFCKFMPNENIFDEFSLSLYDKFLEFVVKERYYEYSYYGTKYLRFMMRAVYVISGKSGIQYGSMLKEISTNFERTLYSWNKNEIAMRFTRLIFWLLAFGYYIADSCIDKIDLSYTINLLKDEKYLDAFNKKINEFETNYGIFADFLQNPRSHIIINLPLSREAYTTVEFNKPNDIIDKK